MQNNIKIPSRRLLGRLIDDLYDKSNRELKEKLSGVEYVCTTADVWSNRRRRFFGMTVHWISEDFKRESSALACKRLKGAHDYLKIADTINDIHSEFGLASKVVATVTDQGSNFVKAFKEFGIESSPVQVHDDCFESSSEDDNEDDFQFDSDINSTLQYLPRHIKCASHRLNLCASTDVGKIIARQPDLHATHKNVMKKCNALWKSAGTPKGSEIIMSVLGHTLNRPGETRWNSLYDSLRQITETRDSSTQLARKLNFKISLRDSDFQYIEEHLKCTKPLADALDILQGENNVFYGTLLPTILCILKKLEDMKKDQWTFCFSVLEGLIDSIKNRFNDVLAFSSDLCNHAVISAVCLPKFKQRWFQLIPYEYRTKFMDLFKCAVDEERRKYEEKYESDAPRAVKQEDSFFDFGEGENDNPTQLPLISAELEVSSKVVLVK